MKPACACGPTLAIRSLMHSRFDREETANAAHLSKHSDGWRTNNESDFVLISELVDIPMSLGVERHRLFYLIPI